MDDTIIEVIPKFTAEEFLGTQKPYEYVYKFRDNPLKMQQIINIMTAQCKEVHAGNFRKLLEAYEKSVNGEASKIYGNRVTDFSGIEAQLLCGQWEACDYGITIKTRNGVEIACGHPILPVERYINIDSGECKIKLMYKRSNAWRSTIVDRSALMDKRQILKLSKLTIDVNSETSGLLVKYLSEVENLNYDNIPEYKSASRLGWVSDNTFVPYMDGIIFDGDEAYRSIYDSIKPTGAYSKWIKEVKKIRRECNIAVKVALASSFSSVLLSKVGALPFLVHFWGTTETGKTVALLLATSVWANPVLGIYTKTFDSTGVGQEYMAGFLNSLPVVLDELQLRKNRNAEEVVYKLAEGVGRLRGNKDGGIQRTATWRNCILTSGECPISGENSGGGAKNRVINIECNSEYLFNDPGEVCSVIQRNYGHAGREFIEWLEEPGNVETAIKLYKSFSEQLENTKATDKQRAAASAILTADRLINKLIFKDGATINTDELVELLQTKDDISAEKAAYNYLLDTIAINEQHFNGTQFTEIWGIVDKDKDCTCIINTIFNKIMTDGGYNPQAVLSWMRRNDKIVTQNDKATRVCRIKDRTVRCVCVKNSVIKGFEEVLDDEFEDDLPPGF